MEISEKELIIKAQAGDQVAFEQLVYNYDKAVLSIAMRFVRDTDDAKDIYQEVFIRVFRSLKKFEFRSEFSTWLFRITTNVCITFKSSKKEQVSVPLQAEFDEDNKEFGKVELVSDEKSPEEESLSNDLQTFIGNAVDSLSERQRITFVLKHYEGYKIREIAEMLNCKEGTVKKYLFDAVNNLRKKLKPLSAFQT
ncbi:MAG: sigma-70 family RNA polymerase sigma factor [Ignavibacteriaceae bacterium]|jgi:RNA polymerase sigma-70 factor (ECF subfamily)|nr:sigma-70 family RNA polymerase sigma factor [Ignavibacteriaceae bacterium]MCW8813713.1 sigma-70 family RNA polymerase sigma factor [Chlorobium sp.]MCW8995612.1 sigma-70 family RNA polymerase sigma factor [Psychromonas sp.]MCW8817481.1 sigma-70 family RNA polymerase sigma factor [Ignavibacteriaceae bacterium]MCW8822725.1 sigma-70 family RNA polymerase sigma factor [Ignavibacteriaceae bacterium]